MKNAPHTAEDRDTLCPGAPLPDGGGGGGAASAGQWEMISSVRALSSLCAVLMKTSTLGGFLAVANETKTVLARLICTRRQQRAE